MESKQSKKKELPGVDRLGRTPLHHAVNESDPLTLKRLLDDGHDPNAVDDEGWTPLHFAAQGNSPEAARLLLEAGAAVDPRDSHGNTPLFKAVFSSRGIGDVIELLREHGADPNALNAHGVSPLKLARTIANYDVAGFFSDLPQDAGA
jgi:uncharacterized protein